MININISNKIKYMYLILTIGMVMYHSRWFDIFNIDYLNQLDKAVFTLYVRTSDHIGSLCMVFFFFMSAFWFYKGIETNKNVLSKWKKRIHTLLIPFLAWTIIIGIYQIITDQITININNLFYHLFETPIAGPLWYILGLLILQIFAPIIIALKKEKN